jgi:hypothetical protein
MKHAGVDQGGTISLFCGVPQFEAGQATLYDSGVDGIPAQLPPGTILRRLKLRFPKGAPAGLDSEVAVLIFVGDLSLPRARLQLVDVVRQGGERPLNFRWLSGLAVKLVLVDPHGIWSHGAPMVEIGLEW